MLKQRVGQHIPTYVPCNETWIQLLPDLCQVSALRDSTIPYLTFSERAHPIGPTRRLLRAIEDATVATSDVKTSSSSAFASVLIASLAAESSRKKPRLSFTNQRRQLCPHCNQNVSMKTLKNIGGSIVRVTDLGWIRSLLRKHTKVSLCVEC